MFEFVKKLFGGSRAAATVPSQAARPKYAAPAPAQVSCAQANGKVEAAPPEIQAFPRNGTAASPPEPPEPQKPAQKGISLNEAAFSKETIDIPLKQLWPKLTPEVTQHAASQPNGAALLRLPLNLVQIHLAKGSMKIPFVHLKKFSPEDLFNADSTHDILEVVIPVSEILPRLKPEHLARRAGQRKVVVPADIEPIFGPEAGKKGNLRVVQEKTKTVTATRPAEMTQPKETAPIAAPVALSPPIAPTPPPPPAAATPISPAPIPVEPVSTEPIRALKLDPALATLRPKSQERTVTIALMDVANFWAENGHAELEKLYRNSVEIPVSTLEGALKKGKAEFQWREVRPWIRLASGNTLPTLADETKVEFPLSFIAPRFFEQQAKAAPRKRVEVGSDIPDVFVRHTPAPAPEQQKSAETVANDAPATGNDPQEFGEIFGQPEKKMWSLGEVSQRTTTLPGVAGAIIATPDGLLVGGSWPGVGGEAVAAFVPQMFNRVTNYTRELKLGEPGHFTLLVENVPLQIFKSANSFFTVIGRAGESLPTRQLNAIAIRLAETPTAV